MFFFFSQPTLFISVLACCTFALVKSVSFNDIWLSIQPHLVHLNEDEIFEHLELNLLACNFKFTPHIVENGTKINNCACVHRFLEEVGSVQIFRQLNSMRYKANDFVKKNRKCWHEMREIVACHLQDVRDADIRCVQYFVKSNSSFANRLIDVPFYFGKEPMEAIEVPFENVLPAVLVATTTTTENPNEKK